MKLTFKVLVISSLLAFMASGIMMPDPALALRTKSAAELEKAKKEGDQSQEEANKARDEFGKEADSANIESFDTKTNVKGSSASTYGVVGFDYLTGVGKVASDPSQIGANLPKALGGGKITSNLKSPLEGLMKSRFQNKWTGQLGDTASGWTEKTGVTEVWFRGKSNSHLGADYNEWVNQWNNITRPRHEGKTPVPGADPDQGAHWFSFYCVHCHGWTAKGDGPTAATLDPRPRNLTNGKYTNFVSNLDLFQIIKGGGPARNLSDSMPPWGNVLQDQDIWNVVAFLRTLPKPEYAVDPDDVTAANAADSKAFQEMNEMLELEGFMAGRGGNQKGGFDSVGGGRLSSKQVGVKQGLQTSDVSKEAAIGDWALTK